jgi:hypothetical protein
VREIKREPEGTKRMNLNVPIDLHNAFKSTTAGKGVDMTTVLIQYIEKYVSKQTVPKKKSRRA